MNEPATLRLLGDFKFEIYRGVERNSRRSSWQVLAQCIERESTVTPPRHGHDDSELAWLGA